jgi:hypothetical protein
MRHWVPAVLLPLTLSVASSTHALAPGDAKRGFREGANHLVGDDSFAALYGRLPRAGDAEALRMHTHFMHVRNWLAQRPATKPELAARRQEILGYFDEYIAKGTTPENAHVPWRTPVFIDDRGTICAVGYLIERSVGRPLAEKIARNHRYNVLEDIAAAMPEVSAWVDTSGLSLVELASIQPGYIPPTSWNELDLIDGPIDFTPIGLDVADSSGTWRSTYPTGQRLAEGRYINRQPQGTWRFFHPSGNLAAIGSFDAGRREGPWTFFHDSKESVRMATGSFMGGVLVDDWRHFDTAGRLIARSRPLSPVAFGGAGYLLHILPREDRVHQWVHEANVAGMRHRLDYLADGNEQIYVHDSEDVAYDARGHMLSRTSGGWQSSDCHWNHLRRATAESGDIVTLHALTLQRHDSCDAGKPVPLARGRHIDAMLMSLHAVDPLRSTVSEAVASNLASFAVAPTVGQPTQSDSVRYTASK